MTTTPLCRRFAPAETLRPRRLFSQLPFLARAVLPGLLLLSASAARAQDDFYPGVEVRESARTSAMHAISIIQAESGDIEGAKRTAREIINDEPSAVPGQVTAVWCDEGRPVYQLLTAAEGWGGRDWRGNQYFFHKDRAADHVPVTVPAGLPADYLAADARHGAVVDFTDERVAGGGRLTSRRYADGHAVIETLPTGGGGR